MDDEDIKPEPASMAWLLTFADLVSLLITFFVLLYSMKVVDTQTWDELKGSFSGVFSIREPIYEVRPDKDTTVEKVDPIVADKLEYVYSLLSHSFAISEHLKEVTLSRNLEEDTLVINVASGAMFAKASDEITEKGKLKIRELGGILRHLDNKIEVAGYTNKDVVRTREFPSNWELSMLRAILVAESLENEGVGQNITAAAYGFSRYDADGMMPETMKKNRAERVEIILHGSKDE